MHTDLDGHDIVADNKVATSSLKNEMVVISIEHNVMLKLSAY